MVGGGVVSVVPRACARRPSSAFWEELHRNEDVLNDRLVRVAALVIGTAPGKARGLANVHEVWE